MSATVPMLRRPRPGAASFVLALWSSVVGIAIDLALLVVAVLAGGFRRLEGRR